MCIQNEVDDLKNGWCQQSIGWRLIALLVQ
jgi:hypothetical protein